MLVLCASFACGSRGGDDASGSASASTRSAPEKSKSNSKTNGATSASAPAASTPAGSNAAGAASDAPALSKDDFCDRAVKIGETNLAKCAESEKANVPALNKVKNLSTAKKECSMRVASAKVEYHGDVAARCIAAAEKRGGRTTFFTFDLVPECRGVLTGKTGDAEPAIFAEECAPGLAMVKNRCVKPVAKNGRCEEYPAGLLGKPDEHPRCAEGLDCFMTRYSADGFDAELACLSPQPAGAPCKLDLNACAQGSSCYQGKCRALSALDGQCMSPSDCATGLTCAISGGVFGKCVTRPAETCGAPAR